MRPPAEPAGSYQSNTSRRSASTGSKKRRSALGPTNSCRSSPVSNWCSKPSTSIGARPRASNAWCSGRSPKRRRLAALQRGEVDIVYSIRGELAEELQRTPGLTLKPVVPPATQWVYFADQWDPKSPWHDERVRRAASFALDRQAINEAITLGHSKITGSIIPYSFDFFWQSPIPTFDPVKAKQLLTEAGYPNGFDAGEFYCDSSYSNVG